MPVVVFSGELPEPSTVLDAKQGTHKYPLNERLQPLKTAFITLDRTHRQTLPELVSPPPSALRLPLWLQPLDATSPTSFWISLLHTYS